MEIYKSLSHGNIISTRIRVVTAFHLHFPSFLIFFHRRRLAYNIRFLTSFARDKMLSKLVQTCVSVTRKMGRSNGFFRKKEK